MYRSMILFLLCAGIALSGACGADSYAAPAKRGTTTTVPPGTVQPGKHEPTVLAAAPDEPDALLVWAHHGESLVLTTSRHVCAPGGAPCKDLPETVCAEEVQTEVCTLDELDGEPECRPVTLRIGDETHELVQSAPYSALRMVPGLCLDAVRLPDPLAPGSLWWRQADPAHPRGWIVDMAEGGGTPQPGPDGSPSTEWYTHPVGGPR
jgi:hypothetical protein